MNRPSMRQRALLLPAAALLFIVSCLGDPTGPARSGLLSLAPKYANTMASAIVDVSAVRVELRKPGSSVNVVDTVLVFPVDSDTIDLTVDVPLERASEIFELRLAMTNAAGDTVFRAGPILVTATSGGRPAEPAEPEFVYVGVGADAAGVRFIAPPDSVPLGGTVTLAAEAFDGQGNAIPNTPIGFELVTLADTTRLRVNDRTGVVTAGLVRGNVAVRAVLASGQVVTHTVAVWPDPTDLVRVSGNSQVGVVGQPLAAPLVARVLAADALGVEGIIVEWAVHVGGQVIATQRDTSDATGAVSYALTLTQSAEEHQVFVHIVDIPDAVVTFSATAGAGVAARLEFITEPVNTVAAQAIAPAVRVAILDAQGNVNTGATDLVTISLLDSDLETAPLLGTASVAAVAGVATFPDLRVNLASSGYVLRAGAGVLQPDTSIAFDISVGPAIALVFSQEPSAAVAVGEPFFVEVEAHDAGGNRIQIPGTVTIALNANPGSATLGGTLTATMDEHVAQFSDLTLNVIASGYTLSASTPGIATAVSAAFAVTVPPSVNAWTNAAGGNWSEATNWSRGVVPTAIDTVSIALSGNYTVLVDVPVTAGRIEIGGATGLQLLDVNADLTLTDTLVVGATARLNLLGGSITGPGDARVLGHFGWSGGSLLGTGVIRVPGSMAITGTTTRTFTERTVELGGLGLWTGTHTINAGLGATWRVLPGANIDIQGDANWVNNQGGVSTLDLQGSALRTTSAGTVRLANVSVSGTLGVMTGTLEARGGTSTGTLSALAGAELALGVGAHSFTAASRVEGAGTVSINAGAVVTAAGDWAVTGTTSLDGGEFDYNGPFGTTAQFDILGGRKGGSGILNVTTLFTWTAGNLIGGGGTTRVDATGDALIGGTAARNFVGQTLELRGTGTWVDAQTINAGGNAVIRVVTGGTLDLEGSPQWLLNQGGTTSFEIEGVVTKTGAGYALVPSLSVSGTLTLADGTLEARQTATSSGTIQVDATAMLMFGTGTHTLSPTSSVLGDGFVQITGAGTVNSNGTWNVDGFTQLTSGTFAVNGTGHTGELILDGGTRTGTGLLTIADQMSWTSGGLGAGGGTTRVLATGALTVSGIATKSLSAHTLEVAGTAIWNGTHTMNSGNGAVWRVLPGASLDARGTPTIAHNLGGLQTRLENQGTMNRTTNVGTVTVGALFVNTGTLGVAVGDLTLSGGGTLDGAANVVAPASLRIAAGTYVMSHQLSVAGTGDLLLAGGQLNSVGATDTAFVTRLRLATGILAPVGVVRVSQALVWEDAAQVTGGGTTRVDAGATLAITGANNRLLVGAATLENAGAATWSGNAQLFTGQGARMVNRAGATFEWAGDGSFVSNQGAPNAQFVNEGSFVRSGTGIAGIGAFIVDTIGTEFRITAGQLQAAGGGRFGGPGDKFTAGAFVVAGGTTSLMDGSLWTTGGGGAVRVSGGTITVDSGGTATMADLELTGGVLQHEGEFVISNELRWSAGGIVSNVVGLGGTTRLAPGADLTISGVTPKAFTGVHRIVNTSGVIALGGSGNINAGQGVRIENAGTFEFQGAAQLLHNQAGTAQFVNQAGALLRVIGTEPGVMGFALENAGVLNPVNDTLRLTGGSVNAFTGNAIIGAGTALTFGGGIFTPTAPFNFGGNVVVSAGTFDVGNTTSTINGDLIVRSGGLVNMTGPTALLTVDGDVEFGGGLGTMSAGRLDVAGDFRQLGGATNFAAGGTHVTRFNGAGAQSITFTAPGIPNNRFQTVHLLNSAATDSVVLGSNAVAMGNLDVQTGRLGKVVPWRFNVLGDAGLAVGGNQGLRPFVLEVSGAAFTNPGSMQPDTLVLNNAGAYTWSVNPAVGVNFRVNAGTVTYSGTNAPEDVIVSGSGLLDIPGANRAFFGDLVTQGNGRLQMITAGASLLVSGNAVFAGGNTSGLLTEGNLQVSGNFSQVGTTSALSYAPSGNHRTTIAGSTASSISFATPASSHFDSLVVAKTQFPRAVVTLLTDARVIGGMTARDGSDIVGPTARLSITGGTLAAIISTASPTIQTLRALELSAAPAIGGAPVLVSPDTVVYNNGVTALPVFPALQYRSVRLSTGAPILMVSDTIAADLDIASGVASFAVGSITFRANGKLRIRGAGQLQMTNFDGNLTVADSAIFGGATTNGLLSNGSLTLLGNFLQQGSANAFAATATHSTRFAGTGLQTVRFANPGSTTITSHFANFNLVNPSTAGVRLESPVYAVGQLVQVMGAETARVSSLAFDSLNVAGINADSVIFDRVPLRIAGTAALTNMSVIDFVNMSPALNHLMITRAGGTTFSPNAVTFPAAPPNTGIYNVVVNNTGGTAWTVAFSNSNLSFATMVGPPRRYLRVGGVLPTVNWNGQTLTP